MKQSILFMLLLKLAFATTAQQNHELNYTFRTSEKFSPGSMPYTSDSMLIVSGKVKLITDGNLQLFIAYDHIMERSPFGEVEEKFPADSVLFDTTNRVAYFLASKKSYNYTPRLYSGTGMEGDSIVFRKKDTVIIAKKSLPQFVNPYPLITGFANGISRYETKFVRFVYVNHRKTSAALKPIYDRVKVFEQSGEKSPIRF